jgi:zinc transporter ZupT
MKTLLIGLATFLSTLLGGTFALRHKDKLHLIVGFSAGAVIGVAFFDLLPEAVELSGAAHDISYVSLMIGIGFLAYLMLDRVIVLHFHTDGEDENPLHRGTIGAASLSFHSFLDGAIIGFAFQVSAAVGAIITAAVLTHDFSDGINTVSLVLKNHGSRRSAFSWLTVDAFAPVLGIALTRFFTLRNDALGNVLAIFCGFFIYIGASELLPESHHAHPKLLTTMMTVVGISLMYIVIQIAKM